MSACLGTLPSAQAVKLAPILRRTRRAREVEGVPMDAGEPQLTSVEVCAGAGGQAIGLHKAKFAHKALLEIDPHAVQTLRANAGYFDVSEDRILQEDLTKFADLSPTELFERLQTNYGELDLLAGGVPCPPFSFAGQQLGEEDERDLFPDMLKLVGKLHPKAVMIENVRGLLEPHEKFDKYRRSILQELRTMGYRTAQGRVKEIRKSWRILEARDYGVPQLRPRAILVAIRNDYISDMATFPWPDPLNFEKKTVYDELLPTMRQRFFNGLGEEEGAKRLEIWEKKASDGDVAPTLVGGSKKHGGADLGPSRAKKAWADLGVDAMGVANDDTPESRDVNRDLLRENGPMLTVQQAAIIQGFPKGWRFVGGKTARYRQVGNAFPPPVATAVGLAIAEVLNQEADSSKYPKEREETAQENEEATAALTLFDHESISSHVATASFA